MSDSRDFSESKGLVSIDPTQELSEADRKLLDTFLLIEEKKHGEKWVFKRKIWERGQVYSLDDGRSITFPNHEINRTPKRYAALVVLGPEESLPDLATRLKDKETRGESVLYLKKDREGRIFSCTTNENQLKEMQFSNENKANLEKIVNFDAGHKIIENDIKENRNSIFSVQDICGYPKYNYRISRIEDTPDAAGGFSEVNISCGKLEFFNGKTRYIDNKAERLAGELRNPKLPKITKKTDLKKFHDPEKRDRVTKNTLSELSLLLKTPALKKRLHTKPGTIQKNIYGIAEKISMTQKQVPGNTLFNIINGNDPAISSDLTPQQRYDIFKMLLIAMSNDHAAGIVHRDIKPENIMVYINSSGKVEAVNIIDYGLAKTADAPSDGSLIGAIPYISPEMAAIQFADKRSDDYSLGLLLRTLFGDEAVWERWGLIGEADMSDVVAYSAAKFYFNIPMKDASFPSFEASLDPRMIELFKKILNGMTSSSPDGRLSSEDALSMIDAFEKEQKPLEQKVVEQKNTSNESYSMHGVGHILSIQSNGLKNLLFQEVFSLLQQDHLALKNLQDSCTDKTSVYFSRLSGSVSFLENLEKNIWDNVQSYEIEPNNFNVIIVSIAQSLFKEKQFLEDEGMSVRDQDAFRDNQMSMMNKSMRVTPKSQAALASEKAAVSQIGMFGSSSREESPPVIIHTEELANKSHARRGSK